jgi:hypothetical protein
MLTAAQIMAANTCSSGGSCQWTRRGQVTDHLRAAQIPTLSSPASEVRQGLPRTPALTYLVNVLA